MRRAAEYLNTQPASQLAKPLKPQKRTSGISDRIRYHERELVRLRALLQLVAVISLLIGPGVAFSTDELWGHRVVCPELVSALTAAGILSRRSLGKQLHQLVGDGIERIDEVRCGVLWCVKD